MPKIDRKRRVTVYVDGKFGCELEKLTKETKMIIGIGTDLVDIRRIEKSLQKFAMRFENRIFTIAEQNYAQSTKNIASSYAKRFAAKEAMVKALGTGVNHSVYLRDIEVIKNENGTPSLRLTGGALLRLQQLTPANTIPQIFLSLSDEYPYAQAQVIIDAN